MTDEQNLRSLLNRAADLPDLAPAPVEELIARGRRRRRGNRVIAVAVTAVAVAVAAVGLPALIRFGGAPGHVATGNSPSPGPATGAGTAAALEHDHWVVRPASPLGSRQRPEVAWTGSELVEIGGLQRTPAGATARSDGAAFVPGRGWRRIATAPGDVGTVGAGSVWTGTKLFLFGGQGTAAQRQGSVAGLYDPATDTWTVTSPAPLGSRLRMPAVVWTGRTVIVAGISDGTVQAASYDLGTGIWRSLNPALPADQYAYSLGMASSAGRVIMWTLSGPRSGFTGNTPLYDVNVLNLLSHRHWQVLAGWPRHTISGQPLSFQQELLVASGLWCTPCATPPDTAVAAIAADRADLLANAAPPGPLDVEQPTLIWTGQAVIAIPLSLSETGIHISTGDMAVWDPDTDRWHRLPGAPQRLSADASLTWAGSQLLVIAGDGSLLAFGSS